MRNLIIWIIVLGGVGYGGAKLYLHHKVGKSVDAAVMRVSPYAQVTYDGVSSTMSGQLTVDGITAKISGFNDELRIDKMGIDTPNFLALLRLGDIVSGGSSADEVPENFGFILKGMHMPADADYYRKIYDLGIEEIGATDADEPAAQCVGKYGLSPNTLRGLGYKEQNMSLAVYLRQNSSKFGIDIEIMVEDMWDIEIVLDLTGDITTNMAKGRVFRPQMSGMSIKLTDRSINQRMKDYCGRLGLSEEETLQAHIDALETFGAGNGIVFDDYVMAPYKEFLAGKPTLLVTARPNYPVDLAQIDLYKPSDVPALLNLSAVAE